MFGTYLEAVKIIDELISQYEQQGLVECLGCAGLQLQALRAARAAIMSAENEALQAFQTTYFNSHPDLFDDLPFDPRNTDISKEH